MHEERRRQTRSKARNHETDNNAHNQAHGFLLRLPAAAPEHSTAPRHDETRPALDPASSHRS
jgi:hypothetical protein